MGNSASARGREGKEATTGVDDAWDIVLREAGWLSSEERAAYARLLEHWRVAEAELGAVADAPTLPKGLQVVEWRGDTLVLKRLPSSSFFHRELVVWLRLRPHRRVVGFRGVVLESSAVLTDYMAMGSLESYILSGQPEVSGNRAAWIRQNVSLLRDVAIGMAHLHAEGFVWRDCAARNILLCKEDGNDQLLRAKITDFGFARQLDADGRYLAGKQSHNLPIRITAPESLATDGAEYSAKSDVWSFGVLIYCMFAQKRPYGDVPNGQVVQGVRDGSLVLNPDDLFTLTRDQRALDSEEEESKEYCALSVEDQAKLGKALGSISRLFTACTQRQASDRPTLHTTTVELTQILSL